MTNYPSDFRRALALHQSGDLRQAEFLYRQVLSSDPQDAEALHLLGLIASQAGQFDAAAALIGQAIRLKGNLPLFCANLGYILRQQGKIPQALACYRQSLLGKPNDPGVLAETGRCLLALGKPEEAAIALATGIGLEPDAAAFQDLGAALRTLGKTADAIACFQHATALDPSLAESHFSLGNLLFANGEPDRGALAYRKAIEADGSRAEYHFNLAVVLTVQGNPNEAAACYGTAVRLRPDYAEAHNNLAILYQKSGCYQLAAQHYKRAVEIDPGYSEALYNNGSLLQDQEDHEEACRIYRRLLGHCEPELERRVRNNLANGLLALGRPRKALAEYNRAIVLDPKAVEAHWNRAVALLTLGKYSEAWEDYEWRLRQPHARQREFRQPRWDGAPLNGRRLLLHAEQGLGDTIQFARFAPLAQNDSRQPPSTVILECQQPLVKLLGTVKGLDLVTAFDAAPEFDLHLPLLSLPGLFGLTLKHVSRNVPYLETAPDRLERWRRHIDGVSAGSRARVGLCWAGNPRHHNDRNRSVSPHLLDPLGALPEIAYFCLQQQPNGAPAIDFKPLLEPLDDFETTAALSANLDLVITVDTAVAHLAGALARPLWLMLPAVADWRWLTERDDSPWYPTARLFRQDRRTIGMKDREEAWRPVIERVKTSLQNFPPHRDGA